MNYFDKDDTIDIGLTNKEKIRIEAEIKFKHEEEIKKKVAEEKRNAEAKQKIKDLIKK